MRYLSVALTEVTEAAEWYDSRDPGVGEEFMLAVEAAVTAIEEHPRRFAEVRPGVRKARCWPFPYHVIYRVKPDEMVVIGIIHSARDESNWLDRI